MATLFGLETQVAEAFDRGTDLMFIERIKDLIINERAMLIHREVDKYGINDMYVQPYSPDLILVNASEISGFPSEKQFLRTQNKIPTPIRYQSDSPFVFVGTVDRRVVFRYTKPYIHDYLKYLKYIGLGIAYYYINNYIYIPNNIKLEKINVDAIYNSLDVSVTDGTGICYFDDMEFPLSADQQNTVILSVMNLLRSGNDLKEKSTSTTRDLN